MITAYLLPFPCLYSLLLHRMRMPRLYSPAQPPDSLMQPPGPPPHWPQVLPAAAQFSHRSWGRN
jgi:hypothetical protein